MRLQLKKATHLGAASLLLLPDAGVFSPGAPPEELRSDGGILGIVAGSGSYSLALQPLSVRTPSRIQGDSCFSGVIMIVPGRDIEKQESSQTENRPGSI